jgi:hypothetical protein
MIMAGITITIIMLRINMVILIIKLKSILYCVVVVIIRTNITST